ncbi:hypothetical protein RND71_001858 [Anisodus tanguticus]|uniref:Uncharacterized protein n=1 Tax=Anisodus tanguticus TaxID=243964 RepID=A0AAE1T1V0_9SOLA|nr:hypothetical protein RND71_001858 [Anisodus tanguticus]
MKEQVVWNSLQSFCDDFPITYIFCLKWLSVVAGKQRWMSESEWRKVKNGELHGDVLVSDEAGWERKKQCHVDSIAERSPKKSVGISIFLVRKSLNKLVHDLLNIDPTRPEVFVALSVLCEKKDERGALSYSEKGNLFLSMNRPEAAVIAFRGAQELRPDLPSYQGLVRSYLEISKIKEPLHAAREAMKAMPQSAKALKLVGDVYASNTSEREKGEQGEEVEGAHGAVAEEAVGRKVLLNMLRLRAEAEAVIQK